ncbi:hypothetical protein SAMN05421630_102318 [Prauserella marina]|uniref:Uncharacterized protein n=1 Tax=Prauserella marina TaxID=530584 RepID=A0A1G6M1W1_9PSEU|nr:hypothetical protein [Prauserella marina]PWV85645.1 hypothetical protein DES30_1011673 [Prauserella marina]SDC49523.1 hypothetical protein SAMN05421630_102318 [Prauserella marina]
MRNRRMAAAVTGFLAMGAAVAIAAAPAAFAQQAITVTNPNGNNAVAAHTDRVDLRNVTSGVDFFCVTSGSVRASTANGSINSGSYTTPADVGDLNVTFNNCDGPLGPGTAVPNPGSQPYDLVITGTSGGTSTGYVGPVDVHVSMAGCDFDVVGHAPGRYNNANVLTMDPAVALPAGVAPLSPTSIVGCFGLVNPGDQLSYGAAYNVTNPASPIIIS